MQCDSSVGECWCVNKMGDEEPGTRIRGKKQYCDAPGRIFVRGFELFQVRKMKFPCFNGGKNRYLGKREHLYKHSICFKLPPNFHEFFYNSMKERKKCFVLLLRK